MYNDHDDNTFSKEDMERQSNQYATAALDDYNSQEKKHGILLYLRLFPSSALMFSLNGKQKLKLNFG
jgi:hypothetical protein